MRKNNEDIVDTFIEVEILDNSSFSLIIETLSRMGITSRNRKSLTQSCHILHKKGRFYVVHFKELFLLDGKQSTLSDEDVARRNLIAKLLEDWGLVRIIDPLTDEDEIANINKIKIIPHSEKNDWELVTKYTIGNRKRREA